MSKSRRWRFTVPLITLVVMGGLLTPLFVDTAVSPQRQNRRREAPDPVSVLATRARVADVPVYIDGVGTARPAAAVTVRPQVDGQLQKLMFRDGQEVKKGDVLAKIDPATYQAQLDQALAKKAQNEALLENSRRDLERYSRLAETNSVTKQQADTQRSAVAQLEAQLKSDQAAIDSARAYLAYTTIVAPIDGRTGIRAVDEGNIVKQSDANGIVSISQVSPIAVVFSVPQQQLPRINKAWASGTVPVEAMDADNKAAIDKGVLQVIDNLVDQTTGTVRLKAEFPNRDMALWPGAFANVRLLVDTLRGVIVVPTAAVQRGPRGTFVYVVKPDETVTVRPVTVTQQDDAQAVVTAGLESGEPVVTTGFARLAEGTQVKVAEPEPLPEPGVQAPVSRRQQRQNNQGNQANQGQRGGGQPAGQPAVQTPSAQGGAAQPGAALPGGRGTRAEAATPAPANSAGSAAADSAAPAKSAAQ